MEFQLESRLKEMEAAKSLAKSREEEMSKDQERLNEELEKMRKQEAMLKTKMELMRQQHKDELNNAMADWRSELDGMSDAVRKAGVRENTKDEIHARDVAEIRQLKKEKAGLENANHKAVLNLRTDYEQRLNANHKAVLNLRTDYEQRLRTRENQAVKLAPKWALRNLDRI
jgi:hypothetical protein